MTKKIEQKNIFFVEKFWFENFLQDFFENFENFRKFSKNPPKIEKIENRKSKNEFFL